MKTITLGTGGPQIGRIGLGLMGMSAFYTGAGVDEEASIRTIHRALELGVNFFDTAEIYGPYVNEELLAKAIAGKRDQAVIATKFGTILHRSDDSRGLDGSAENVRLSVEGSLRRLGTDYIDVYYQHRMDPNTPIEETVGALSELIAAGKIRGYGLSEAAPATIRRAHAVHPVTAIQTEYSLWSRDPEAEILPTVRELGIGFVPYSPLGRGFLTGTIRSLDQLDDDDFRRQNPRFEGDNLEAVPSPGRWRSRGCSRRATTSRRSRARSACRTSRRTSRPTRSPSPRSSSRRSTTCRRPSVTAMPT